MDETMMVMIIYFHNCNSRVAKGEVKPLFWDRAFAFQGMDQMLLIMDDIMDEMNFQLDGSERRSLQTEKEAYHFLALEGESAQKRVSEAVRGTCGEELSAAEDRVCGKRMTETVDGVCREEISAAEGRVCEKEISEESGEVCEKKVRNKRPVTAAVRILYRQHSSMQGTLTVEDKRISFRSALELIRMMHEYVESTC